MLLKGKSTFCDVLKNYYASGVSSKCLHATSSNALFCTHYVNDVIYHVFSHGDVSIRIYGKNVNVMLEYNFALTSMQRNNVIQRRINVDT